MTPPYAQKYHKSGRSAKKSRYRGKTPTEQRIWGIHPVLEALHACPQCVKEIIISRSRTSHRVEEVMELAHHHGIPVNVGSVKKEETPRKGDETAERESSQGVSARIVFPFIAFDELLNSLNKASIPPPLLLALDSIQDPHNLGAIIRSAVAAGANGLILPKDRSASITSTVAKISAGAVFHLRICRVTNLVNCLSVLKEVGIWIFGATKDGASPVYDVDLTVPACLVIGSEGKGLRPFVAENCDLRISIPMQGSLDSLNASVAAGIILFETVRQRKSNYI
jgi:23S rRNA (guanosine2251-2'-O)-methyltransferase